MRRPSTTGPTGGATTTTQRTAGMVELLGSPCSLDGVHLARGEYAAAQRLYGYHREPLPPRPPEPPDPGPEPHGYRGREAWAKAKPEHDAWERWDSSAPSLQRFMQDGADLSMMRQLRVDGLRCAAWLARYCEPGEDPLKVLVRLAIDAGMDVDPADVAWAEDDDVSADHEDDEALAAE